MNRPTTRQWVVLWSGAIWIIATLLIADEYVGRGIFAAGLVTGLLYWQCAPKLSEQGESLNYPHGSDEATEIPVAEFPASYGNTAVLERSAAGPVGVAGWLALLICGLGIVTPISALAEISKSASNADDKWQFGGSLVVLAGVIAGGVYASIALGRQWPTGPRTARRFIIAFAVLSILGLGMLITEGADPAQTIGQMIGTLGWAALWTSYLRKSRRVRNTYLAPSDERPTGQAAVRLGTSMLAVLVMWLGTVMYSNAQNRVERQYDEISPYEWLRAARQMDPKFDRGFADGILERLRSNIPNSTVTLGGPASFDDLSSAFRVSVAYTADVDTGAGGSTRFEGELRSYFHAHGVAVIESACIPTVLKCSAMQRLLASAEEALLPRLNSSQMSGILPGGKCEVESQTLATNQRSTGMTCSYAERGAASLTLTRSSLEEARRDVGARINATAEFKRALVKQVLAKR